MVDFGFISLGLIIATGIVSYIGFNNQQFFQKYLFEVEKILIYKDYKRLITSGFLHVNWLHLIFNMVTLYLFSGGIDQYLGPFRYLLIYVVSLVGGNLLSLFIHKNDPDYTAVGASGAVNGVIFAAIAVIPGLNIMFIPGWLFGLIYVGFSIYGIRSRKDNVGHDAHLGGALIGLLLAVIMQPSALQYNLLTILLIAIPSIIFLYIIITRPGIFLVDNLFFKTHTNFYSPDHKYNAERADKQKQIDAILEKIHRKGMNSLSRKEKEMLKEYSRK